MHTAQFPPNNENIKKQKRHTAFNKLPFFNKNPQSDFTKIQQFEGGIIYSCEIGKNQKEHGLFKKSFQVLFTFHLLSIQFVQFQKNKDEKITYEI